MDKILTLIFLIILLLILVVPNFAEEANIAVIFVVICIVVAVSKILFSASKTQDINKSDNPNDTDDKK